jgi:beta-carotene 3-hydroxylase
MTHTLIGILLALAAFFAMEFVAAVAHRRVYHGAGWRFHESHHTPRSGVFEKNDVFPLFFSLVAMGAMALSFAVPALWFLLPISIGVSLYGAVYLFVHDLVIHRRLPGFRPRWRLLRTIHAAHAIHHRDGGEPFGLLYVPKAVRERLPQARGKGAAH